jgi:TonB family protein
VVPGQLVDLDDPDVASPERVNEGAMVRYPEAAARRGLSAVVIVEALVGEDGRVLEARALESSVTGVGFEAAAERQVAGHRYRPATKSGVPVRVRMRVAVRFTPP